MATFTTDTFTGTTGVNLNTHTGETGATWTRAASSGGSCNFNILTDNKIGVVGALSSTGYLSSGAPGSADYNVEADIVFLTAPGADHLVITGRDVSAAAVNCYFFGYQNGAWVLGKWVANSNTVLKTSAITPTVSQVYHLKLHMEGTSLSGYVDGVQIGTTATDSAFSAAGKAGVFGYNPTAVSTNSTRGHIDNFTASDAAATAVTMTGPTSGPNGVASSNFTVGVDSTPITGTVVVTPNDSSQGGTFTPTSVSLTTGSPTGTFTYTPASTGVKTIAVTNNGGLSNPSTIAYTSQNFITVSDSNLLPGFIGMWDSNFSGEMVTASPSQIKFACTGTANITLRYTPPSLGTIYYKYSLQGAADVTGTITSASSGLLSIGTGLSTGTTYTVLFTAIVISETVDLWGSSGNQPAGALRVTGFIIDVGGSSVALGGTSLALKSTTLWADGDSITRGLWNGGASTDAASDATHSYDYYVAQGLNAEWVDNGWSSQGWVVTPSGDNVPTYEDGWDWYNNAHARSFAAPPTYWLINQGQNGGGGTGTPATSGSTGTVRAIMAAQRAAAGVNTKIIYMIPFSGGAKTGILNDLSYYGGGTTASNGYTTRTTGVSTSIYIANTDTNTVVIDLGASDGSPFAVPPSVDGIHPATSQNVTAAALVVAAIWFQFGGNSNMFFMFGRQ